ncbi:MAG TPA: glyoxalase superfamily protein [Actinomycetota bacterium]|nr:glyoxalase superfamily protein [Actinomycetota bacterium]
MPVVTVQLYEGRSLDQKRHLAGAITKAMVEHAGADPSGLHVVLQEIPPENWARAGVLGIDREPRDDTGVTSVSGLHHLLLQVSDIARAEAFYLDGLGFTVRKREAFGDGRPLIVTDQGLGLTEGGPEPPGPVEHIAFRVKGVEEFADMVEASGGEIVKGPGPGPYGLSLYFLDPDGNKIEFHE